MGCLYYNPQLVLQVREFTHPTTHRNHRPTTQPPTQKPPKPTHTTTASTALNYPDNPLYPSLPISPIHLPLTQPHIHTSIHPTTSRITYPDNKPIVSIITHKSYYLPLTLPPTSSYSYPPPLPPPRPLRQTQWVAWLRAMGSSVPSSPRCWPWTTILPR